MSAMTDRIPLIILVGPTAVGKTAFAIKIAESINAEVISSDSRYFYRGMDIGTAKPTFDEMRMIPHHLIDIANPDEIISLGDYQKRISAIIQEIYRRNKTPLLVGGTGQYIRSLVQGWNIPETAANPGLRIWFEKLWKNEGKEEAGRWLRKLDLSAFNQVDLNNPRRVIRALEVVYSTGATYSSQRTLTISPYRILQLGLTLPRTELYARIDQRIESMIANGFIEEVKRLLENGYDQNLPSMSAIGYPEIRNYLHGTSTLDEAFSLIKRRTRVFVRRQANWFKETDPSITWFTASTENFGTIVALIKSFLQKGENS